jgi:hypothetical protein
MESGIAPDQYKWLSVSEAILDVESGQDHILSHIRGRFEIQGQGVFALYEAEARNKMTDFNDFIIVSIENADSDQEFDSCDGELVVVTGVLVNGHPPMLQATSINEADDIVAFRFGTCDP